MQSIMSMIDYDPIYGVWTSIMDEHNYLVRRWQELTAANGSSGSRGKR